MSSISTNNEYYYPLQNISKPERNDVLLGRGAGTNKHPGNKYFRTIVKAYQNNYVAATNNYEKYLITMEIMQCIRNLSPPGRFILKDSSSKLWNDVGDEKARRKISQALRENLSELRNNSSISSNNNSSISSNNNSNNSIVYYNNSTNSEDFFLDVEPDTSVYHEKKRIRACNTTESKVNTRENYDMREHLLKQNSVNSISLHDEKFLDKSSSAQPNNNKSMEISLSDLENILQTYTNEATKANYTESNNMREHLTKQNSANSNSLYENLRKQNSANSISLYDEKYVNKSSSPQQQLSMELSLSEIEVILTDVNKDNSYQNNYPVEKSLYERETSIGTFAMNELSLSFGNLSCDLKVIESCYV